MDVRLAQKYSATASRERYFPAPRYWTGWAPGDIVLVVRDRGGRARSGRVSRTDMRSRHDRTAYRGIRTKEFPCISLAAFL